MNSDNVKLPHSGPLVEVRQEPSPLSIIELAINKGISPEQLGQLVELQRQREKDDAERKFAEALSGFQAECPMVFKRRRVLQKDGKSVRYTYSSYDDIKAETRPIEAKWGISTSFDIKATEDGKLLGTCRVRVGTHHEDHSFIIEVGKSSNGIMAHGYGEALSYLKRYLYCAALDIVLTDEDDDMACGLLNLGEAECHALEEIIKEKNVDRAAFFKWASQHCGKNIEKLDDIPASHYATVKDMLNRAKGRAREAKK